MIAAVDVDYRDDEAVAAAITFREWTDAEPTEVRFARVSPVAEYIPGEFYRRELPCLLAVIKELSEPPELIIIDGYVWLKDLASPGLGAKLYEALDGKIPVIGVAKTCFLSAEAITATVVRGQESTSPLHVTAVGTDAKEAALAIGRMHGPYRLPTLLKRVDQECRNKDCKEH
jgi:deoxyribonuclease V